MRRNADDVDAGMRETRVNLALLAAVFVAMAVSAYRPYDWPTWWLEVAPVIAVAPMLLATYSRFRLTPLAYWLIAIHALILILGAHYTYARVPFGFWIQEIFDFQRNHYDRIGHVAQGFIPAIVAREILIRLTPLGRGPWLFFLTTCVCLAFSAFYELIEWWVAVFAGSDADAFLATQGDVWDTQWDMFLALLGAVSAQLLLGGLHDRQLRGRGFVSASDAAADDYENRQ
jgi:putative membrane protein